VRREGVAHSRDEFEVGLRSIAIPLSLVERDGPVAINVSLPTSRAGRVAMTEIARELRATAEAIRGAAG
jgi:DNA-binding IclR family transcriptional regulator